MRGSAPLLTVAGAVMLAAGCGGTGQPPNFQAARGWHVIAEPGQIVSAANISFSAADRSQSAPIRTVASLPQRGIVIWVQWVRRGKFPSQDRRYYPRRQLPLRVRSMAPVAPEGFTCPRASGSGCGTRSLQAGSRGWDVAVWVFFGTAHPPRTTVAVANAELARLTF
jgi:hypothetical protein